MSSAVARRVFSADPCHDLVASGRSRVRRAHLQLHILGLAGIDRDGVELLAAVLLGERGVEILRRLGGKAHRELLAAVVLDGELKLEARLRCAAQFGKLRRQRQLGRQILGQRDCDRQLRLGRISGRRDRERLRADGCILRHVEPQFERNAGVGCRHRRRDRLAAAHQRRRPARGHAGDGQIYPLGRQTVVVQTQIDRRRFAWPHRDRRIVAHEIKALDVLGGVIGLGERRKQRRESGKRGDEAISHWCQLPCRISSVCPAARSKGTRRGSPHCWRNRDKVIRTTADNSPFGKACGREPQL